jgi:hypothetical protein
MSEGNLTINQNEAIALLELIELQPVLTREQQEIREKLRRFLGRKKPAELAK